MDIREIVNRIGIIRTRANLSARALSLAIGKNASYIHLLESNKTIKPWHFGLLLLIKRESK